MNQPLLCVRNLNVFFAGPNAVSEPVHAVRNVSLDIQSGEVLGLVGESGSGKSAFGAALMGLHPARGSRVTAEHWRLGDTDLLGMDSSGWQRVRGRRIAMVFQDPMTALNPYLSIGYQLDEVLRAHTKLNAKMRQQRCLGALNDVGLPDGATMMHSYPHMLSGGMRQRAVIAMALLGEPDLLVADEPTTALDVTVQAQILALLGRLCAERHMAMVLITHDLAVLAGIAHRVAVMYAGQWVEVAQTSNFYEAPKHPYSRGLLQAMPDLQSSIDQRPRPIEGAPPPPTARPAGCPFAPRCRNAMTVCLSINPAFGPRKPEGFLRCHNPEQAPSMAAGR